MVWPLRNIYKKLINSFLSCYMFNAHAKELSLDINISVNYNIHVQKQNTSFGR